MDIPLPPSPPKPATGEVDIYSPSHVTSDHSDDDDKIENVFEQKIDRTKVSPIVPPPPSRGISIGLKRNPVLGGTKVAKLFNSFKAAKAGTLSIELVKTGRTKLGKLKNFDDDEADQEPKMKPFSPKVHIPSPAKATIPTFAKEKEAIKKLPSKLNIESIIEEEKTEKAKHIIVPPTVQQLTLPAAVAAAARVDANLLSGVMSTKVDNMGFVTSVSARKALDEDKKEKSRKEESGSSKRRRSRSRDRRSRSRDRRSRSRSREKRRRSKTPQTETKEKEIIPFDLKELPKSWHEIKENHVDVAHPMFPKLKASLAAATASETDSVAKKQLTVKARKGGDTHDWVDPYSNECESAYLKSKKDNDERYRTSFDDYKYAEYPTHGVKKTKTTPAISWSEHPRFTTKFLTRKEIFDDELPASVEQLIKASSENLKTVHEIMKQAECVSEESFLNESLSLSAEKEFVAVLEEQQVEEIIPQPEKKKKKKKNKKKLKEDVNGGKIKKDKSKKKKRKKDKKGKTEEEREEKETDEKEAAPSETEVKKKRKRTSDQNEGQEEVTKKHRKKREDSDDGDDSPTKKQKKKKKKRKKNFESGEEHADEKEDDASPLQDEHTPIAAEPVEEIVTGSSGLPPVSGLANIGTWEDPMFKASDLKNEGDDRVRRSSKTSAMGSIMGGDAVVDKLMNIAGYASSSGASDQKRRDRPRDDERDRKRDDDRDRKRDDDRDRKRDDGRKRDDDLDRKRDDDRDRKRDVEKRGPMRDEERHFEGRRTPSPSNRSLDGTPPSDPRLKRYRSGPRTPSRSPPPPNSGSRHRTGPRTPSPTDVRRSRHHPSIPPSASPKPRRHEFEEPPQRRPPFAPSPSPRRFGTPPHDAEPWHPAEARSPRFTGRPPSPSDRRPLSSSSRERRRSPSPRYSRYPGGGGGRYSPSYRHRMSPSGDRRRSRTPPHREGYHRRRGSPPSPHRRRSPVSPSGRGHHGRHDYHARDSMPDYYHHPEHDYRNPMPGPPGGNSPKRMPLDERLEKELGIKIQDETAPDYSRPPPGYPFSAQQRIPTVAAVPQHLNPHLTSSQQQVAAVPLVPQFQQSSAQQPLPDARGFYPAVVVPVAGNFADPPEEGRLVRVGNMLQIVPESPPGFVAPMVPVPGPVSVRSGSQDESGHANELMRKMEEMKSKKEEEQRLKREKRISDRLFSKQQLESLAVDEPEPEGGVVATERILETIEKEEEEDLEAREARLLAEAISSVPEMDDEEEVRDPMSMRQEDIQSMTFSDMGRRRSKSSGADVRYISLKPLARKERRRQQRLAKQIVEDEEADENFVPRSPVPLPDVSTCKPILVQLGFSLSARSKKSLKYADGVVPGQGSPDHAEEKEEEEDEVSPPPSTAEQKPKRRKRIRVRIIQIKLSGESSDSDESEIPGPPPGSPPLLHTQQLIEMYGLKQTGMAQVS